MYCSRVRITAAFDAPNQDAIRSTDALPGTWNSGRTTGLARTPKNSIIPQSVRNGIIKLNAMTMLNRVPQRSTIVAPVSAEMTCSGPILNTTITTKMAPMTLDTRYSGVVENARDR